MARAVSFVTRDPTLPDMKLLLGKSLWYVEGRGESVDCQRNHGRTNHPAIVVVDSDEEAVKQVESIAGRGWSGGRVFISGAVTVVKSGRQVAAGAGVSAARELVHAVLYPLSFRAHSCHPERSEGSGCLPGETMPEVQAKNRDPRFARDDNEFLRNDDEHYG